MCDAPLEIDGAVVDWAFDTDQVASAPVVGDVDGDGVPEVVVSTYNATDPSGGSADFFGHIVVLDGVSGDEVARVAEDSASGQFGSYARSGPGLADVDGDGVADIVYAGRPQVGIAPFENNSSLIHAVDGMGNHIWSSHAPDGSPYYVYVRNGAPSFANLDLDPESEIILGTLVLDHDGTVVFDQDDVSWMRGGGVFGSNGDYLGGISAVADLNGDDYPEIISGRQAWSVSWESAVGAPDVTLNLLWEATAPDGFPAVADMDNNGTPEVIVVGDPAPFNVRDGEINILDGATGELWCAVDPTGADCIASPRRRTSPIAVSAGGRGGPPTVADFDGDGRMEIGVAGATEYCVYDVNRPGEDIRQPAGDPVPAEGAIFERWCAPIRDASSNNTSSTAFDFNGDGAAEVIFGDECHLRVYDGARGDVVFEIESSSITQHEHHIAVDVDSDARTELLVVSNDANAASDCGDIPGYVATRGATAWTTDDGSWMPARPVWSSHGYHVSDASSAGTAPATEAAHWETSEFNGYRHNVTNGIGVLGVDLDVDLFADLSSCGDEQVDVVASVFNRGETSAPAGTSVSLYRGTDAMGELRSSQRITDVLAPGESVQVSWTETLRAGERRDYFIVLDESEGTAVAECREENNSATLTVSCEIDQ